MSNLQEISVHHTHPLKDDTDSDGLADAWEIANDLDPRDDGSINPANGGGGDPDGDGSTNLDEQNSGTHPKANQDFPVQLISISRSASGNTITPPSSGGHAGSLNFSASWSDNQSTENLDQALDPGFIANRLSSSIAFPATPPEEEGAASVSNLANGSVSSNGRFTSSTGNGITNAGGDLSQAKVWLKSPVSVNPREFRMLKTTRVLSTPLASPSQETAAYQSVDVETFTIPANQSLSNGVELLPQVASLSGSVSRTIVSLHDVRIKPAAGMVGVLGDMIPSNQLVNPELHFVSPKKTAEIPNDYVVFEVAGIDESQIKSGDPNQIVMWAGGEEVPNAPLQRRIKRDQAKHETVKITALQQHGGEEVVKLNVWIVWANVAIEAYENVHFSFDADGGPFIAAGATYGGLRFQPQTYWRFKFTILPTEVVSVDAGVERPNLSGNKVTPVPGEEKNHFHEKDMPADHASKKWDLCRKVQIHIANSNGLIPKNKFPDYYIYRNQPAEIDLAVARPQNPVEGNDDPSAPNFLDEDANPYQASQKNGLSHDVGQITSFDGPIFVFETTIGVEGATLAQVANFEEFARLEIHSGARSTATPSWFRISDYVSWHHVMAATYGTLPSNEVGWVNSGSTFGLGKFEIPGQ